MEPYLALDTSGRGVSVAVGRGDRLLAEVWSGGAARHSESLVPAIDFALRVAGVAREELAGVVVAGGPGSFTGLRIGGAAAKALVRSLGVPLFAYSGLVALAASLGAESRPVCALFDARRGEVYAGCYRFPDFARVEALLAPVACPLEEVLARVAAWSPLYAGDGALRHRERIEAAGGRVVPGLWSAPRAAALLWLAERHPEAGRVASPAEWEPEYLRPAAPERGRAV